MAEQNNTGGKKRGSGRPPGSKNKPRDNSAFSGGPTRQEVLNEMQRRADRDKRNNDIIWSITMFALGVFLFFTVVMDTTGSFGMAIHDIFNGLFGILAFTLPFLLFIFGGLLLAGRLQHLGARTAICSILIFLNLCILNSSRFIETEDLRYGLNDIAEYYTLGVNGQLGGAIGMEIASLLAKLFGMPGLMIISLTVLTISIFLVANSPISRLAADMGRKMERRKLERELDSEEAAHMPPAVIGAGESIRTLSAKPKKPIWKSILSGITGDSSVEEFPHNADLAEAADIPAPFGNRTNTDKIDDIEYTQVVPSPVNDSRSSLFGKFRDHFLGIDSETGEAVTTGTVLKDREKIKADEKRKAVKKDSGKVGMDGRDKSEQPSIYAENRNFDSEDYNYGYRGRKADREKGTVKPGYGLGDPDAVISSGSYGLDAHGGSSSAGKGLAGSSAVRPRTAQDVYTPVRSAVHDTVNAAEGISDKRKEAVKTSSKPEVKTSDMKPDMEAAGPEIEEDDIAAGFNSPSDDMGYELPPVSLLKKDTGSRQMMSDIQLEEKAALLEQTLNNFGVDARVINVTMGSSVTRYEVQPAVGVKVASITKLADDIALNLRARSIRIEAPIPGKAAVGIEVENDKPSPVFIRELIESEEFMNASSNISFVVGKDISGNNIVANLKDMPHMLIAGATGSGKSVCINAIITSFLYKARPSELKLIMIDPKVVELGNYNGIPHMLTPVVTDPRKASRALAIAVEEMDKRYELFAKNNVKDLESYNELMRADQRYADCKPQIVIIIDELADLMMAAPSEVENSICRLAQKARAAGMHLIVATQRPSVDVVTGLIKANIPSRIAFSVASQFDSRTILDMAGAEKLLGKGDMLFSPVGSTKPYRVQGPFISEKETDKIIKFVKKEGGDPEYDDDIQKAIDSDGKKGGSEPQDELTEDAIAFIFKSKQASVSMLQRRFRIGYNRAARIIDEIEEKGIIGPSDGSRPRALLITEEEYYGVYSENEGADEVPEEAPEEAAAPAAHSAVKSAPVSSPTRGKIPGGAKRASLTAQNAEAEQLQSRDSVEKERTEAGTNPSHTQAMDSFNSLPESVRRMVMDADSEDSY